MQGRMLQWSVLEGGGRGGSLGGRIASLGGRVLSPGSSPPGSDSSPVHKFDLLTKAVI